MNQARIKTEFGELVIEFIDELDLSKKLEQLNVKKISEIISKKIDIIKTHQILEEFKDLYTLDSKGIRLLRYPDEKTDQIRLALFLAGKPLSPPEIKHATGINKPTAFTGHEGFEKIGKNITIDSKTRKLVLEKIIPSIRGADT
jgi:hypothetical protein